MGRALLTDREREIVSNEAEVDNDYRYQTISRVRKRFDRLESDIEAFEEHGDLADELRQIVCKGKDKNQTEELFESSNGPTDSNSDSETEETQSISSD